MKTISRTIIWALLLIVAVAVAVPQQASALGTASGTSIANRATINYQVGGVPQSAIGSSPTGNTNQARVYRYHIRGGRQGHDDGGGQ